MKTNKNNRDASIEEMDKTSPLIVGVDYERYARFLEDADLTDAEKRAFIDAVWGIIFDFVSLGFSVHPLQQIEQAGGSDTLSASGDEIQKALPPQPADVVSSTQPNQQENTRTAGFAERLEREES